MIRPITCVCMILAGCSGLYLYQVKHRAQLLDRQIDHTIEQTKLTRDHIRTLHAEWALLNEPERLQELSARYLPGLHPLAPTQFVQLADLGSRLPKQESADSAPAMSAEPQTSDANGASADDTVSSEEPRITHVHPAHIAVPAAKRTDPATMGKTQVVTSKPQHMLHIAQQDRSAHAAATPHDDEPHHVQSVRTIAVVVHPTPSTLPRSVNPGVMNAVAGSIRGPSAVVHSVSAYAPARPMQLATPNMAAPGYLGYSSALGMAHAMLPPPVPVAADAYR